MSAGAGVMFLVWIPSEKFELCQRNEKIWEFKQHINEKETELQSHCSELSGIGIAGADLDDEGESSNKEYKKFSSSDTFTVSVDTNSLERNKRNSNGRRNSLKKSFSHEDVASLLDEISEKRNSWKQNCYKNLPKDPTDSIHNEEEEKLLNDNMSMEKVMKEILEKMKIPNCMWQQTNKGNSYQITFSVATGKMCDDVIHMLSEWGIGQREGSSISIVPCTLYYDPSLGQDDSASAKSLSLKDTAWNKFISSVRARLNVAKIVDEVKGDAALSFDYIVLLICASILAAFGLIEDNTLFLAASMLISPLMGPIIAATFGSVIKDVKLQCMGIKNELIGLFTVTVVGFVFGIILCLIGEYGLAEGITNEMNSRGTTHSLVVGIMIALPSGAAVALAILGENIGSLVGVAISASLLPPAVNAGLMWSLSLVTFVANADSRFRKIVKINNYSEDPTIELAILGCVSMCVTFTNILCVYVMGVIFLKIKEVAPMASPNQRQFWKHDIKIARDYNKTSHHHHEDPESKLMDEIVEHETINFRGVGAELLKNYQTWSPMTLRNRRESCPARTSIKDLEALYFSVARNKIHDRLYMTGSELSSTSRVNISPPHEVIATEIHIPTKKWNHTDAWYSTKHVHDCFKSAISTSAPLEKIPEMKTPLTEDETNEASSSNPKEIILPSQVKRKFIVTLAKDPLHET